jgi:alpha-glucosidase
MEFCVKSPSSFVILLHGQPIIIHKSDQPFFYVGKCQSTYKMHLGHFIIEHREETKVSLQIQNIKEIKKCEIYEILFCDEKNVYNFQLKFVLNNDRLQIEFPSTNKLNYIRSIIEDDQIVNCDENPIDNNDQISIWFSLEALSFDKESIEGCGLQFINGNLRGKTFPIWVSEWYHDQLYSDDNETVRPSANTSYHPQPMFNSSRGYTFCVYGSAYAQFDFSDENFHHFHLIDIPYRLELSLVGVNVGSYLYPLLPEWIHNGIILSIQGGIDIIDEKLSKMSVCGTKIAGVWAQDWCGKRITSFGKRVFWNWKWNEELYPNLKEKINQWKIVYQDCRFLGYINPYIAVDGSLFKEANENDFLVKRLDSENNVYLIDFGEFNGAIIDLTNPQAFQWYKKLIQRNLIDIGLSGWMADFGEYLPCDVRVYANISGSLIHNLWPILWARCNQQAIQDSGKSNEIIFFMRSGYLNIQRYSPLFWTGDQSVDFSIDTGLSAGIRSSLSLSLSNILNIHTDIGGYFSRNLTRTREVLLRWCEMETFNIFMRTHEGNRPSTNFQFDNDFNSMKFISRMSQIHFHLKPYFRYVIQNCYQKQKSTLKHHTNLQYFIGDDLLIVPVIQNEITKWKVIIPDGEWIHIWTNQIFLKNHYEIDAPLGYPPVFYRSNSQWKEVFQQIRIYF